MLNFLNLLCHKYYLPPVYSPNLMALSWMPLKLWTNKDRQEVTNYENYETWSLIKNVAIKKWLEIFTKLCLQ